MRLKRSYRGDISFTNSQFPFFEPDHTSTPYYKKVVAVGMRMKGIVSPGLDFEDPQIKIRHHFAS
jgi:hypothetical protein